ncbi:ankyrin repeat domain-containing protein 13D-like [Babylonia areolata]|uniref:ankyrin repeat domain-containing protein 13D-like n=1 Tax=Babylonia areolata TaxID=304850 RepID=UPI003FD149AC
MASKTLQEEYPIHWLAWHNDYRELDRLLGLKKHDVELKDPRGRTPLHLSVTLGHLESTRVLLRHGADAGAENTHWWSVLHESVCSGDPELVQLVLQYRDFQRYNKRTVGIPELLQQLKESQDFYVEMKWEFTSWVPLISRMCPSDTYRVWKSGSSVRIDTTLLGFDNMSWQRGSRSYVFKSASNTAVMMEIDHDNKGVYSEMIRTLPGSADSSLMMPSEEAVAARLTSPVVTTYIDTNRISFERSKSGIWGWRSDKAEAVNGFDCKVFTANNVELVTKSRTEHLTKQDKERSKKSSKTPLETFLGATEEQAVQHAGTSINGTTSAVSYNPSSITPEEYFNSLVDLGERDIGRPIEQTTKVQKFKAALWLCEDFPLSLQEQVLPIIDLMATSNAHFAKLRDFITLQLPAGFPVKIEIPLFHVLNARVTFGNIFGSVTPADHVTLIREPTVSCTVDEECFEAPRSYHVTGDTHHERLRDEDDELLQFAIQQSLVQSGSEEDQVTFWEALNRTNPAPTNGSEDSDRQMQRAIAASLELGGGTSGAPSPMGGDLTRSRPLPGLPLQGLEDDDAQLQLALQLSQQDAEAAAEQQRKEEEELERILKLSLMEK